MTHVRKKHILYSVDTNKRNELSHRVRDRHYARPMPIQSLINKLIYVNRAILRDKNYNSTFIHTHLHILVYFWFYSRVDCYNNVDNLL